MSDLRKDIEQGRKILENTNLNISQKSEELNLLIKKVNNARDKALEQIKAMEKAVENAYNEFTEFINTIESNKP